MDVGAGGLAPALIAGAWGLASGSSLVLGAAAAYAFNPSRRVVASIMAFGCGVLISALAFELMDEAAQNAGVVVAAAGFLAGACAFTFPNILLSRRGAAMRKHSGHEQPTAEQGGSGLALALGALLDGIPEGVVIGVSLLHGGVVSWVVLAAVSLSNFPEALGSASGMRKAGRSRRYVFGVWGAIALASGVAALLGNLLLSGAPPAVVAAASAIAAGAILAMLIETMVPEAFEVARDYSGLIAAFGFVAAFALSREMN